MADLPCPAEDWPRFSALLGAAIEIPEAERGTWLESLDGDDSRLKPWLARVLDDWACPETQDLLAPPRLAASGFAAGMIIGPYRLEAPLGEGGMGEVWRAARDDDGPQRSVALKLPHPALLSRTFLRRFRRERDILATLSHPAIAQLYDAGTSSEGHPFLALELVQGEPITAYCGARNLALAARIDLVRQILDALSFAHQRLIVHRDIKPSNVLVEQAGQVKLLDFGIAKILGPEAEEETALTQLGRPATPAYAAPEQLAGEPVTVASDVFSTGVLLFEVVTGHRPFARVPSQPDAPAAPAASASVVATVRGSVEARRLARQLRGDLDAVIGKALSLDPAGRYASAEAFAADLRRWRDGLPVRARRIGWLTRTQKFVRRNRVGVALAACLLLAVAGGTGGIAWQAQRATQQAQRAAEEARLAAEQARRATAIKDFMVGLFRTIDPRGGGTPGRELTARALLDTGAARADAAFRNDPATSIDLLETFASIYDALDDFPRARLAWQQRLQVAQSRFGPGDPRTIQFALDLAGSESEALDYADAQAVLEKIHPPILRAFGPNSAQNAVWLTERAHALRGRIDGRDEAVSDLQQAIAIFGVQSLDQAASGEFVDALELLSFRQFDAEQFAESLATLQRMRAVSLRVEPGNAMHDIEYLDAAGLRLERMGNLDAAEADFAEEQSRAEKTLGKDHFWFDSALSKRIYLAALHGERAKIGALLAQAGPASATAPTKVDRARALAQVLEGNGAAAVPTLEVFVGMARQRKRDPHDLWRAEAMLGEAYDQAGEQEKARAMLRQARDDWQRYGVPGQVSRLAAEERWGQFLLDSGEADAARTALLGVVAAAGTIGSAPLALAQAALARISLSAGDLPAAQAYSVAAVRTLDALRVEYNVRARIDVWLARAETLRAAGDRAGARDWALKAKRAADSYDAPGSRQPQRVADFLAVLATPPG
jgi:serine/threonine-protein kinase